MERTAERVIISGRVQGVGYRAWTVKTASRMGLSGWVRNRNDGTVEAVFHGAPETVAAMLEACRQGPMMARVDRIERLPCDEPPPEESFSAKPTV